MLHTSPTTLFNATNTTLSTADDVVGVMSEHFPTLLAVLCHSCPLQLRGSFAYRPRSRADPLAGLGCGETGRHSSANSAVVHS